MFVLSQTMQIHQPNGSNLMLAPVWLRKTMPKVSKFYMPQGGTKFETLSLNINTRHAQHEYFYTQSNDGVLWK